MRLERICLTERSGGSSFDCTAMATRSTSQSARVGAVHDHLDRDRECCSDLLENRKKRRWSQDLE